VMSLSSTLRQSAWEDVLNGGKVTDTNIGALLAEDSVCVLVSR
jgi:hypothetical protein